MNEYQPGRWLDDSDAPQEDIDAYRALEDGDAADEPDYLLLAADDDEDSGLPAALALVGAALVTIAAAVWAVWAIA